MFTPPVLNPMGTKIGTLLTMLGRKDRSLLRSELYSLFKEIIIRVRCSTFAVPKHNSH